MPPEQNYTNQPAPQNQFTPPPFTPPPVQTPVPASAGSSSKFILGLIVIAALGAGAFLFIQNNENISPMNTVKNSGSLSCRSLMPDDKFRQIAGVTDFALDEEDRGRAVEGLNMLRDNPGDLAAREGIQQLICGYAFTQKGRDMQSIGGFGGDVTFTVTWGGRAPEEAFNSQKEASTKIANEGASHEINGQILSVPPDPSRAPVSAGGIGAMAMYDGGTLYFVSSNKKYSVSVSTLERDGSNDQKRIQEEMAKVIDSNL